MPKASRGWEDVLVEEYAAFGKDDPLAFAALKSSQAIAHYKAELKSKIERMDYRVYGEDYPLRWLRREDVLELLK